MLVNDEATLGVYHPEGKRLHSTKYIITYFICYLAEF